MNSYKAGQTFFCIFIFCVLWIVKFVPTSYAANAHYEEVHVEQGFQQWEGYQITFQDTHATKDNPWGFTGGIVEMDSTGSMCFLTPNTAVTFWNISYEEIKNGLTLSFEIYPQVSDSSDGAGILVWYLSNEGEIVKQEEFSVNAVDSCMITCLYVRTTAPLQLGFCVIMAN